MLSSINPSHPKVDLLSKLWDLNGRLGLGPIDLLALAGGRSTKLMMRQGDGQAYWRASIPDFMIIRNKNNIPVF